MASPLRLAAEFCGDKARQSPAWVFANDQGQADSNNKPARWVAYQGPLAGGKSAGVAVFDHPANPRHPVLWQTRTQYPYLNPSLTCKEDYVLKLGERLTLRYGVLIHAGAASAETVEKRWKTFAAAADR